MKDQIEEEIYDHRGKPTKERLRARRNSNTKLEEEMTRSASLQSKASLVQPNLHNSRLSFLNRTRTNEISHNSLQILQQINQQTINHKRMQERTMYN